MGYLDFGLDATRLVTICATGFVWKNWQKG